ncbi:Store-operated calcium entry-associated regulatory factor [Trinorchestia longiramus]|nr:Store-operated calcium entry-associated regulatory factor [Trinorchestia longiramus]
MRLLLGLNAAACYSVVLLAAWLSACFIASVYRRSLFGHIDVSCEGYDYPEDPYILAGSCGLRYSLDYTKDGYKQQNGYGQHDHYDQGDSYGWSDSVHSNRPSKSRSFLSGIADLIAYCAMGLMAWAFYKTCINPTRGTVGDRSDSYTNDDYPTGGGGGNGYGWNLGGNGGGGGDGYNAGYDDASCRRGRRAGGGAGGFWTGAAAGGLLGYMLGGNRRGAQYNGGYNRGWFGGGGNYNGGGGGGGWGSGGGSSFGGGSGTRTASGFGGTSRR